MEIEANLEFDYGEVLSKIKGTSIKALQGTIRDVAKDMLNDILVRDFPAGRATKSYITTGQLADTICVEGNGLDLLIYVDPAKLSLEPYIDGWLGVHESIYGEDFREPLVEGLNEGRSEEKKIIALRMFRAGMKLDNIADMVDASKDEIRSWIGK